MDKVEIKRVALKDIEQFQNIGGQTFCETFIEKG